MNGYASANGTWFVGSVVEFTMTLFVLSIMGMSSEIADEINEAMWIDAELSSTGCLDREGTYYG